MCDPRCPHLRVGRESERTDRPFDRSAGNRPLLREHDGLENILEQVIDEMMTRTPADEMDVIGASVAEHLVDIAGLSEVLPVIE